MRTPDEIKKGLEMAAIDCRDAHDCEKTCAYHKACIGFYHDMTSIPCVMVEDALALIQQKEQDNAELSENIKWMEAERDDLKRLIQQLEAERDALMVLLKVNAMHVNSVIVRLQKTLAIHALRIADRNGNGAAYRRRNDNGTRPCMADWRRNDQDTGKGHAVGAEGSNGCIRQQDQANDTENGGGR